MARRRLQGLERVLGVNALFSTAYGNVGSSIYYALGLVASYALGLTPVVFVITGMFFVCTAATYAEATAMYPEAGGSSSFARRAFNEFWSFFAAWGQMLNYVVTVAISAFFVPHYLGSVFWPALRHAPGDIVGGAVIIAILAAINVVGVKESAGLNIGLAVVDFLTQLLLVVVGVVLVLAPNPDVLVQNVHLGIAPTWKDFILAIPIGMIAYTGIETISNMAEEARDELRTIPAAIKRVEIAVFAIYFTLPAVALVALPVKRMPDGSYETLLGLPEEQGGYAGGPDRGRRRAPQSRHVPAAGRGLRRHPRCDDSLPRDERGSDRRLAPRVLDGNPSPAAGPAATAASEVPHAMDRSDRLRRRRDFDHAAGSGELPGQPLRVRGDVVVHDRALRGHPIAADRAGLPAPVSRSGQLPSRRARSTGVRDRRRTRYRGGVRGHRRPASRCGDHRRGLAHARRDRLHPLSPVARSGPGLDAQGRDSAAGRRDEAEYDSVLVPLADGEYDGSVVATAAKLAARKRRGIHVLALITVPASLPIRAAIPEAEAAAESMIEQAKVQAGARVSGHVERIRSGQAGRRIIEEAIDMRAAAIVMPLPRRVSGGSLFGKTLETVLTERPCRVIIETRPDPAAARHRPARSLKRERR
jgi:hypothetical protein